MKRTALIIAATISTTFAYYFVTHYTFIDVFAVMKEEVAQIADVQAAWFQAIFSVVAILVAILLGRHQAKEAARLSQLAETRAQNDRQEMGKVYAAICARSMHAIQSQAARRRDDCAAKLAAWMAHPAGPLRSEIAQQELRPFLLSSADDAPRSIDIVKMIDQGDVAIHVAGSLDMGAGFNRTLRGVIEKFEGRYSPSENLIAALSQVQDRLQSLVQRCASTKAMLKNKYGVDGSE